MNKEILQAQLEKAKTDICSTITNYLLGRINSEMGVSANTTMNTCFGLAMYFQFTIKDGKNSSACGTIRYDFTRRKIELSCGIGGDTDQEHEKYIILGELVQQRAEIATWLDKVDLGEIKRLTTQIHNLETQEAMDNRIATIKAVEKLAVGQAYQDQGIRGGIFVIKSIGREYVHVEYNGFRKDKLSKDGLGEDIVKGRRTLFTGGTGE